MLPLLGVLGCTLFAVNRADERARKVAKLLEKTKELRKKVEELERRVEENRRRLEELKNNGSSLQQGNNPCFSK